MQTIEAKHTHGTDAEYDTYLERMQAHFLEVTKGGEEPLLRVASKDLWAIYLATFGPEGSATRQYHNCNACHHFIRRFGRLVVVDPNTGKIKSAMWNEDIAPADIAPAIAAMRNAVEAGKIESVFVSDVPVWGSLKEDGWAHLHVRPAAGQIFVEGLLTPAQFIAQKTQDMANMRRAVAEFHPKHVKLAVQMLEEAHLPFAEKVIGPARFLDELQSLPKGVLGTNLMWRAVAKAPAGFCHPRSSMLGTILDDIKDGKNFNQIKAAYAAKVDPIKYQRPTAPPKSGAVEQAERDFAKLGLASSLMRRYMKLDEVRALWRPPQHTMAGVPAPGPIFGGLIRRDSDGDHNVVLPATKITVQKFCEDYLGRASKIEVEVPSFVRPITLLTAVDPEAKFLFKWNHHASWYYPHTPGRPGESRLKTGWNEVAVVTTLPCHWDDPEAHPNYAKRLLFLVAGARTRANSLCIFPECVRSDLHGVRSVIEAYSESHRPDEQADTVAGLSVGNAWPVKVRVTLPTGQRVFTIEGWE